MNRNKKIKAGPYRSTALDVFLEFKISMETIGDLIKFLTAVMHGTDLKPLQKQARKLWKQLNPAVTKGTRKVK